MDIRTVREIIQYGPMTTVPLMPAFVRGVINLRGAVVPVIDLHARFGRAGRQRRQEDLHRHLRRAMRDGERIELGLLVDAVSEVIEIAAGADRAAARTSAPPCGATSSAAWARSASRFVDHPRARPRLRRRRDGRAVRGRPQAAGGLSHAMTALRDDAPSARIAALMHATVGLSFTDSKKPLVSSRLAPRIQRLGLRRLRGLPRR